MLVKPSRGAISFFALLAIAVASKFGWRKYEQTSFAQDAPPAHSTRRLLRCVLGRDAERVLAGRLVGRDVTPWADRITDRLRRLVAAKYSNEWPARCVPIVERLTARFSRDARTSHAAHLSEDLQQSLAAAARDRVTAIDSVERGMLGSQLAALALEVSVMSTGAEEGWDSHLRPSPTDLDASSALLVDRPIPLPHEADSPMFAMPDMVLYRNALDGRLHRVTYDAQESPTDRDIGRGAPVSAARRQGAVLVADDLGDSLFLPGGEPAPLVALPGPISGGSEALGEWQIALTPAALWLLSVDRGTIRVRKTPRTGQVQWGDPLGVIGGRDAMLGGVLLPDPTAPERMSVIAVRRGARGFVLERYDLSETAGATAPTVLTFDSPAFDPHLVSCAAGGTRYLLVASDQGLTMSITDGVSVHQRELTYALGNGPTGRRLELTCSANFALLLVEIQGPRLELIPWDREGTAEPEPMPPPSPGEHAHLASGAIVGDDSVLAIVDNGTAIRSYIARYDPTRHARPQWSGGALMALDLGLTAERHEDDVRLYEVTTVFSETTRAGVLESVREGPFRFVGRLGSRDSGQQWRGLR